MSRKVIEYVLNQAGNLDSKAPRTADGLGQLKHAAVAGTVAVAAIGGAALVAGAAFVTFTNDITDTIDEANTMAQVTGLSAETIQGLRQAARASGKELNALVPKNLSKQMLDASRGSKAATDNFAALGITVTEANGSLRSVDAVFREVTDALGAMDNSAEQSALSGSLLSRNGREIMSAFADSGALDNFVDQARTFGIDVGPEAVAKTSAWQHANANLALSTDHAKQAIFDMIGTGLLEWLTEVAVKTVELTEFVRVFSESAIVSFGVWLAKAWYNLTIGPAIELFKNFMAGLSALGITGLSGMDDALAKAGAEAQRFRDVIEAPIGTGGLADASMDAYLATAVDRIDRERRRSATGAPAPRAPSATSIDPYVALEEAMDALVIATEDSADQIERALRKQPPLPPDPPPVELAPSNIEALGIGSEKIVGTLMGPIAGVLGPIGMLLELPSMFNSMVSGITSSIEGLPNEIENLPVTVLGLVDAIANLPGDLGSALAGAIPQLVAALAKLTFEGFILGFRLVVDGIGGILRAIGLDKIPESIVDAMLEGLAGLFSPGSILGTDFTAGKGEKTLAGIGIPFLDVGGDIDKTGLAVVHKGERVLTEQEVTQGSGGGIVIQQMTVVANDVASFTREMQRQAGSYGLGGSVAALVGG